MFSMKSVSIFFSVAVLGVIGQFGVGAFEGFRVVERPVHIDQMAKQRGNQENATPILRILEPVAGAVINSSTVKVRLDISGDLKGYMPMMDHSTKMGNHIHVILDNQAYEAYYNLGREFELRNVSDGEHTLRVFPSRPWHESYKNEGAFQMVRFTVKNGGADVSKPTTSSTGMQMSEPYEERTCSRLSRGTSIQKNLFSLSVARKAIIGVSMRRP